MKQFKLSEVNRWESDDDSKWISGDLLFPHRSDDASLYYISVFKDNGEPYHCALRMRRHGHTMGIFSEECDYSADVEAFVNRCFDYVRKMYEQYLVGDIVFTDLGEAKEYANGREVVTIHGPYSAEQREFFEGEGEFWDNYA